MTDRSDRNDTALSIGEQTTIARRIVGVVTADEMPSSDSMAALLNDLTELERHVNGGGVIGSWSDSEPRSLITDAIDTTEMLAMPPSRNLSAVFDRLDSIREASRENEGGDGWLSSSADCGHAYDNWLASGC